MEQRFKDIFELNVPNWIHEVNVEEVKGELQEEFIDLASDPQLKVIFSEGGYEKFWLQEKLRQEYPNIWKEVRLFYSISFQLYS